MFSETHIQPAAFLSNRTGAMSGIHLQEQSRACETLAHTATGWLG